MNKAGGVDGIPVELFQILRGYCERASLNIPANLENSAVATELEKVSFHSSAKECSNYCIIALISHDSKVMLKILQARLQQYMNRELPDVQAGFQKRQRNQRSNCQHPYMTTGKTIALTRWKFVGKVMSLFFYMRLCWS